jgi:hypothetical protein
VDVSGICASTYGVAVSGNTAYVAGGTSGLCVYDITTLPFVGGVSANRVATYAVSGNMQAVDVAVAGKYAYLAVQPRTSRQAFNDSVLILDITNPAAPTLAGSYETDLSPAGANGNTWRIAVAGEYIYLAGGTGGQTGGSAGLRLLQRAQGISSYSYATGSIGSNGVANPLWYPIAWTPIASQPSDVSVSCTVTSGTCSVAPAANSANVYWYLNGATAGDREIRIVVGDQHYFLTTKDSITVGP